MQRLEVQVLGVPQVQVDGARLALRPRRLGLVALLAVSPPGVSRTQLSALLFPDLDPEAARGRLRLELHRMGASALGPFLHLEGDLVRLSAHCDALDFREALARGEWSRATALYGGDWLSGVTEDWPPPFGEWLAEQRERDRQGLRRAYDARLAELGSTGRTREALDVQRALLGAFPLAEEACDGLTRRLVAAGQLGEAVAVQSAFRERFEAELGWPAQLSHRLMDAERAPAQPPPAEADPDLYAPPLTGRETLWRQLEGWLVQAPPLGLLLLEGEAGVGKSYLTQAFARAHGAHAFLRGLESQRHVPYGAVLRALGRRPDVLGRLGPRTRGVLTLLGSGTAGGPEAGEDAAVPGSALGLTSEAQLLAALTQALLGALEGQALGVVEDVQWLDPSSLRALLHAREQGRALGAGTRLICTARPGEVRGPGLLAQELADLERAGQLWRLEVPPLSRLHVLSLVRRLSGSARAIPFSEKLYDLSGGNPYVLLTYLRGLRARGLFAPALEDSGGASAFSPEGEFSQETALLGNALPGTLRELLRLTLGEEGEAVRRFLQAAAVQAQPFDAAAAAVGGGLSPEAGAAALDRALAQRWVQRTRRSGYRLQHDLLRQVLEEQATEEEQASALHRRLAEYFAAQGAGAAAQARHWQGAGELGRAAGLWRQVAEDARAQWAHREALYALDQAAACLATLGEARAETEVQLQRARHAQALNQLGLWEEALGRAQALLQTHPDADLTLRWVTDRTHLLWRRGEHQAALDFSAPYVSGAEPSDALGLLRHNRAGLRFELGQQEEALRDLLDLLGPEGEASSLGLQVRANAHNSVARFAYTLGNAALARTQAEQAITAFRELGSSAGLITAHVALAGAHESLGELPACRAALDAALGYARAAGNPRLHQHVLTNLCAVCAEAGLPSDTQTYATEGLELAEELGDLAAQAHFSDWLLRLRAERRAGREVPAGMKRE